MNFVVTVIDNYNDKRVYSFTEKQSLDGITIGRSRVCNIRLSSLMISNHHSTIKIKGTLKNLYCIDVTDTSSNGTQYENKDIGRGYSVSVDINDNISLNMSPRLFSMNNNE